MDSSLSETANLQNPKLFIASLEFNDGTKLNLKHNSIVVFTGSNNSGKSQVLKDIEHLLDTNWHISPIVVSKISSEFTGEMNNEFIDDHFYKNKEGYYYPYESPHYGLTIQTIFDYWKGKNLSGNLHKPFIRLLDTERRLIGSKALQREGIVYCSCW